jgi:hypothetical protein
MSYSYLNPSMHMAQVLELFFIIRVRTLWPLGGETGLIARQGSRATSDIF